MPHKMVCDWCLREETPKVRLPEAIIIIPKGWVLMPVDEAVKPCEVIVSCNVSCRKQLGEARVAIREARADREKLEEKKKRFM